jgi:3'(2'), 5'-bisphosphate nucleotidase
MPNEDDHQLAIRLATEAGHLLVRLRDELAAKGVPEWRVMDAGDLAAHQFLAAALADARPGDKLLSEEGADDRSRLTAERVWIVDPLDGTSEYGEGRSDWAVHVALVSSGSAIAGAVALPSIGITLGTDPAPVVPPPTRTRPRMVTSRSRITNVTMRIAKALDAEIAPLGSAGAKAMAVVMGEADIYAHAGGQYEWDNCAPAAVALAAGMHASRIDGTPLVFNKPDVWSPDFLICRADLAQTCLDILWK